MLLNKFSNKEIELCEDICKKNNLKFAGITRINKFSKGIYFKAIKENKLINILYSVEYNFITIQ